MIQQAIASATRSYYKNLAGSKVSAFGVSVPSPGVLNQKGAVPSFANLHVSGTSSVHGFFGLTTWQLDRPSVGWLDNAFADLLEADIESAEEGFTPSSQLSKANAKVVLRELQKVVELSPSVYPTADQEIAIQFVASQASVLILCDSSGSGACFSFIDGKNRRARFDDAVDLPSGFATAELLRLTAIK
jgi:hypothetical protein